MFLLALVLRGSEWLLRRQVGRGMKSCCAAYSAVRARCWRCSRARARTYYVTIAGLGGEPDYEQRFKMWADDIDKQPEEGRRRCQRRSRWSDADARTDPRRSFDRDRQAKPSRSDALVLMLIGHGTFDGVDYKFNLPGPGSHRRRNWPRCWTTFRRTRQLVVNMTSCERRLDRVAAQAESRRDHRHQDRHREERHGLRALLGGSSARSGGRYRQERNRLGAGGLPLRAAEDRRNSSTRRSAWPPSTPCSKTPARAKARRAPSAGKRRRACWPRRFPLVRLGAQRRGGAAIPTKRHCSTRRKSWNSRSTS